ncbi:hypothetical protein G7050_02545 [Dysgonomonas sp. HDW5A]|uniref:hypothetical protein n=1 Tax=Dysgonomonas sp. HDW5A TaxID=2714926 RepID=UPI00140B7090|nr:hypothetical protein [Dysgonomonas sp. HDW5A]QIK58778.1 hypothetical protein G7050_02545 [Dysgonomonas sp. HDW5A]
MNLTPETVSAYKELITNPQNHGLELTSITDFFIKSDKVTAKHILARAYIDHIQKPLPKVILYIIMDEIYGQCSEKADDGNLGYRLTFNTESK